VQLVSSWLTQWSRVLVETPTVRSASQELPCLSWKPKVHDCVHNSHVKHFIRDGFYDGLLVPAQPQNLRTIPCRLSATTYSQLPSISGNLLRHPQPEDAIRDPHNMVRAGLSTEYETGHMEVPGESGGIIKVTGRSRTVSWFIVNSSTGSRHQVLCGGYRSIERNNIITILPGRILTVTPHLSCLTALYFPSYMQHTTNCVLMFAFINKVNKHEPFRVLSNRINKLTLRPTEVWGNSTKFPVYRKNVRERIEVSNRQLLLHNEQ
jgi:hypothetical protein